MIKPRTPVIITGGPFKGQSGEVVTIQRPNDKLVYAVVDIEGAGSQEAIPIADIVEVKCCPDSKDMHLMLLKIADLERHISDLMQVTNKLTEHFNDRLHAFDRRISSLSDRVNEAGLERIDKLSNYCIDTALYSKDNREAIKSLLKHLENIGAAIDTLEAKVK